MQVKYTISDFNVNHFVNEIGSLSEKLSGMKHEKQTLTIYLSQTITPEEKVLLDTFVENHDGSLDSPLRVYRVLPKDQNPLISDFSILGFRKISPSYERGRKTQALYKCVDKDEIIVEKIFNDVRDESGTLTALEITFNWYNEDGEIGLSKTEQVKAFNKYQAETEERQRRERQIDYLVAGAKGTPIEASLNAVFDLLYNEVILYKEQGVNDAMVEKLDSIIYNPSASTQEELEQNGMWYVLNSIPLPRVDDPTKFIYVIQSIKYQIGAMTLAEIEAANA